MLEILSQTPTAATAAEHLTDSRCEGEVGATGANEDIYTVEKLLKQKWQNREHQFLIKWLGFPASQNSWEPATNIVDKRVIDKFYKQHPWAKRYDGDPDYSLGIAALSLVERGTPMIAACK